MAYKKLRQLATNGQAGNIKVKIIRMWKSINFASDELMSLDMILMDEQGDTIRATIWKNLIDNYKSKITEGFIYELSNFKVQEDIKYRPVNNTLKIVFLYNTNVKKVEEDTDRFHQDHYFEFASTDTLLARKNLDKQCSDVIGLLTKIKQIESRTILKNSSNPRQRDIREIELLISSDQKVRITLWGDLAHSLSEDVVGKHTVLIVTTTMVEGLQGMLSLKTTNGSRLYKDLDIPKTWKFIGSVPYEENFPKLMQVDRSTQGTLEDQMFFNRRTLQEITQMRHDNPTSQDFIFTSKATVDQLDNDLWWYMSCNDCNKLCTKIASKYHCSKCNKCPEATTPRYWIRLRISDHTATTTCSIFDDEAQRLLKTTITNLLDSLNGNSEQVPKIIHQLCGRTLIFRFKLSDQNLTQGKEYYLVKRTFDTDDKLEMKHMDDKDKGNNNNGLTIRNSAGMVSHVDVLEEISNDKSCGKGEDVSTTKLAKKRRRIAQIVISSDEESTKNCKRKEYAVEQALKTAERLGKRLYRKKMRGDAAENSKKKDKTKDSNKATRRSRQKRGRISMCTQKTDTQLTEDIEEANANKTSNINENECSNIDDSEAVDEQAICGQKGLSKLIAGKKRKPEALRKDRESKIMNVVNKYSKKSKAKVRKRPQERRKEQTIVVHNKISENKEDQQSNSLKDVIVNDNTLEEITAEGINENLSINEPEEKPMTTR
ncbi:unnamed protein product [Urochloa decumbens]|uniref:Uncharacterized protein n=1 Tax=Urochloa decumbens TaxID=240449 RepID=A0ABC9CHY6_9POAL